jgi:hypothetical protein
VKRRVSYALLIYVFITLAATWPLARGLGRDVAWDLGDSLLVMWAIAWDCEQLLALLAGDVSRLRTFFDGNIFHPAPLTLAYSDHFIPQALQVLPIYAVSGNPILCYNLLFLSTFVLSALGTYLLVRELTGSDVAAFIAGLLFAFAPYRLVQSTHLQVLSAQWMPFALYGLRRYFDSGRLKPLLGSSLALAAQSLSSGYYLLYFAPFAAAYAVWEIWRRRLWTSARTWRQLAGAGACTIVLTAPFLLPYAAIRETFDMTRRRSEVAAFSADVYAYATAYPEQRIWGAIARAYDRPEGALFPGLVPVLLALAGIIFFRLKPEATRTGREATRAEPKAASTELEATRTDCGFRLQAEGATSARRRIAAWLFAAIAVAHAALAMGVLLERRVIVDLGVVTIQASDATQLLLRMTLAIAVVLWLSPPARSRAGAFMRDRGYFAVALIAALWLSLGPVPRTLGRPLNLMAPYGWLFDYVPGFEGLRVPARFAMVVTLMLAVLGGYGAAALWRFRWWRPVVTAVAAFFLLEGTAVPFLVNGSGGPPGFNAPEPRLYRPRRAPRIYLDGVSRIGDGVLAELPLGTPDFDLRAMYYSTVHWRPILNGYSGFFPPHYGSLVLALSEIPRHAEVSLQALRAAGATHVLVHEGAYLGNEGKETSDVLRSFGAVELYRDGQDVLLALRR